MPNSSSCDTPKLLSNMMISCHLFLMNLLEVSSSPQILSALWTVNLSLGSALKISTLAVTANLIKDFYLRITNFGKQSEQHWSPKFLFHCSYLIWVNFASAMSSVYSSSDLFLISLISCADILKRQMNNQIQCMFYHSIEYFGKVWSLVWAIAIC